MSLNLIHEPLNHIILTESTYDPGRYGQRMSDGRLGYRYAGNTSYQIYIPNLQTNLINLRNLIILGTTTSGTTTRELDIQVNII